MPKKHGNGSVIARAIFAGCPAMTKLGTAAATVCATNKITSRNELSEWLSDNDNVKLVIRTKNCGMTTVRELFAAIGLPSPFDKAAMATAEQPGHGKPGAGYNDLLGRHVDLLAQHDQLVSRVIAVEVAHQELRDRHHALTSALTAGSVNVGHNIN
tara:strand:- start:1031 stop:1498 length:468 start_codon:yes stop_codon:yes gene_type:complete